ncbi:hypothetical protein Dimus_005640 [Dionaea muscipula]
MTYGIEKDWKSRFSQGNWSLSRMDEMEKNRKASAGSTSDGAGRRMKEVACPTCTVHLQNFVIDYFRMQYLCEVVELTQEKLLDENGLVDQRLGCYAPIATSGLVLYFLKLSNYWVKFKAP